MLCALFVQHFRPLVDAGHVYVAMPPLYRIDLGKEIYYALDEAERDGILDRLVAEKKRGKPQVTRFKGLGEMNPPQLRETTMDPNTRRLVQLTLEDFEATSEMMDMLLAKKRAGDRKILAGVQGQPGRGSGLMRLGFALACALLLTSMTVSAEPAPELRLLSEHAVDGMRGGNLSGLAQCGKDLWTVSDRDDDQIYRLDTRDSSLASRNRAHRRAAGAGQRFALGLAFAGLGGVVRAWRRSGFRRHHLRQRRQSLHRQRIPCGGAASAANGAGVLAEDFADAGSRSAGQRHVAALQCVVRRPGDQSGR